MMNEAFYEAIFPGEFWSTLDLSELPEDVDSMFADEAVFDWVIDVVRPSEIIEVGTWKGHSANYMIDRCKQLGLNSRLICVDTFLGGPEHWLLPGAIDTLHRQAGRPTIFERFLGNVVRRGNAGYIFPLTLDSFGAAEVFRHFDFKADLIFIDGGHDPDSVRKDVTRLYPRLSERGVMFGDDYQYEPLATTLHNCADELGLKVLVKSRKWILCNEALIRHLSLPDMQLRQGFSGWVHP